MVMAWTGTVFVTLAIILGLYDLSVVVYGFWTGKNTTPSVSSFLIKANLQRPRIALCFGIVLGHLFGVMYPEECPVPSANILAPNFWMISFFLLALAYWMSLKKIRELLGEKSST